MLHQSLAFIRDQLNIYFRNSARWSEEKVILSSLNSQNQDAAGETDRIRLSVINIFQESTLINQSPLKRKGSDFERSSAPLSFNVDFLASANCSKYEESLKLLSDAISFFQVHHFFDHARYPTLGDQIRKLSVSILDADLGEMTHFWSVHGASYTPSIAYRMRLVTFESDQVKEVLPSVSGNAVQND